MQPESHYIYYIANQYNCPYYPAPFPFPTDPRFKGEFNILSLKQLKDLPQTPECLIQKVINLNYDEPNKRKGHQCGKTGYTRIIACYEYCPIMPHGEPINLLDFMQSPEYKVQKPETICFDLNQNYDLCLKAMERNLRLDAFSNLTEDFCYQYVVKDIWNYRRIPDSFKNGRIFDFVLKSSKSASLYKDCNKDQQRQIRESGIIRHDKLDKIMKKRKKLWPSEREKLLEQINNIDSDDD